MKLLLDCGHRLLNNSAAADRYILWTASDLNIQAVALCMEQRGKPCGAVLSTVSGSYVTVVVPLVNDVSSLPHGFTVRCRHSSSTTH